ncbi:MAG: acyl-ACP--UDP-N-acetylglucosamine O-acyltransferase [Planctomycetia bacterium]|nr:acyl-ACP--UDP-N-acetylglucosamine O-acyltransferase [Planctomycetia bacterium]
MPPAGKLPLNRSRGEPITPAKPRAAVIAGPVSTRRTGPALSIHPLAAVSSEARLGVGVTVGAFATVEAGVELGDYCVVASGAIVKRGVRAGCHNEFGEHCVVGGAPQHAARPQQVGTLAIGDHNVFREYVTVHRALKPDTATTIGDHNYVMATAHVGHDCVVGNNCIFANGALLGGHVTVEDRAFVSGAVAVHQFCRIGRLAMVGGHARVVQDIPPYMLVDGQSGCIVGLNIVGLKRSGHGADEIAELKAAYRTIYRRGLPWKQVLEALEQEFHGGPALHLRRFLNAGTRGFAQERRAPPAPTLRLRTADDDTAADLSVRSRAG